MQTHTDYTPILDRVNPQAPEIERAVLGAILLEPGTYAEVEGFLSDEDFYVPKNATIFRAIKTLHRAHEAVDMITVMEALRSAGELERAGGMEYISGLTGNIASAVHVGHHANIVKQKSVERQMILTSNLAIKKIHESEDVGDVMLWQHKEIERLQDSMTANASYRHISVPVKKAVTEMYLRREAAAAGRHTGITTGLSDLDSITGGWQRSDLIIIAARPAMGKTAFALHFARAAALAGHPVALFSLEMSDISLANRLLLSEGRVSAYNFKTGKLSDGETVAIEKASGVLHELPVYVDDNADVSMPHIHSTIRRLHRQGKCDIAIIDYLQLISGTKNKNSYREQEISQMSREAKRMAKELNIPVILLSQLNRESERRSDKRPALSDLRESGAIEQDADIVCLIHRPEYYQQKMEVDGTTVYDGIEFIIAKYRNGATGNVYLQHDGTLNRIFDFQGVKPSRRRVDPDRFIEPGTDGDVPF
jgi:replicative DNA helicase